MICSFDYYGRLEQPTLILCSPDDTEIGVVNNAESVSVNIKFNDISNISYIIYKDDSPSADNTVYNKHIERRQIYASGLGYFIINNVTENEDENGCYKEIEAQSCESELNNISMPFISGTYQLYKAENFDDNWKPSDTINRDKEYLNENCLLYEIMKTIPSWTLEGQADFAEKYADLAEKHRTFESVDTSIYSFFKNNLSESYECYVHFDIENRTIRIYKYEDVFREIPAIISNENFLDSCSVKTGIENYVNCLDVGVTSGVNISSCNPLGNRLIYNFDHDIDTGLIDGSLKDALEYWRENMEYEAPYSGYKLNSVTVVEDDKEIVYSGEDSIQEWIDAPLKLTEYKVSLLEAVGTGKQEEIDAVINKEDFLSHLGMDYTSDGVKKKEDFKSRLAEAADLSGLNSDESTLKDTSVIEQEISSIFQLISFEKDPILNINIPSKNGDAVSYTQHPLFILVENETRTIAQQNKVLLATQELKGRLLGEDSTSEISLLKAYQKGYEAQLKALQSTVIEGTDTTPEMLDSQIALVQGYIDIVNGRLTFYNDMVTNVLDAMIGSIEGFLNGRVLDSGVTEIGIYERNGFMHRFSEYLGGEDEANALYVKLTRYIKQQSYSNENIIITESLSITEKFDKEIQLYDDAVSLLNDISVPSYEVTAPAQAFMLLPEFREAVSAVKLDEDDLLSEKDSDSILDIHSALYIKLPNGDIPLFHLLVISISYEDAICEFTLGNRLKTSDPARVFADLQKTTSSTADIVAQERVNWGVNSEKVNELMSLKNSEINTTFRIMKNITNNVTTGSDGFKCFATNPNGTTSYGMWMANGVMMFINENGTPEMAIGRLINSKGEAYYGINGRSMIVNSLTADKFAAGAVSKGTNYIRNGSFEGYINEDDVNLPNYWHLSPSGSMSLNREISTPIGNTALYLSESSTISQDISEAIPAGEYILSYYCGNNNSDDVTGVSISLWSADRQVALCNIENNREALKGFETNKWTRSFVKIVLSEPLTDSKIIISNNSGFPIFIDGIMLEKSANLNEYSPHITEVYAKYTTIDDSGVSIYNGKLTIFNQAGTPVLQGDPETGDLAITGVISAKAGGDIAGWQIGEKEIYKENNDNVMRISSSGDRIFSFRNSEKEVFYVDNNGKLFADGAEISGRIDANAGEIGAWTIDGNSLNNNSKGELILNNGLYTTKFDGYGIYGGKNGAWGMSVTMAESSGGANGTWNGIINNIFSDSSKTYDNLALAGREEIFFGLRPNGTYKEAGKIYWNSGLFNEYPIFKIEAIQANRIVIGGVVYYVNAFTDTGLVSVLNPLGRYLGLTTLY